MSVAVVGAGISGLTLGYELSKRGEDVVVLEADQRPGGKIRSFKQGGFLTEAGPNGFLANEPATLKLVEELGLQKKMRSAEESSKRRFVFSRGAPRELAMGPKLLTSGVMPLSGWLRLAGELFTPMPPYRADESLDSFMRRHLGRQATEILIDAMQSGIYAGDPARLSVGAVFPVLTELEREHRSLLVGMRKRRKQGQRKSPTAGRLTSFDGGLQTLTDALAERLGDRVHRGAPVRGLMREGDRWKLSANGASTTADRIVLCTPAPETAQLLAPLDPGLAGEVSAIEYATVTVVHLGFDDPALFERISGFGMLAPEREHRKVLGILYISSFFPWRAEDGRTLLTVMVGGARHADLARLADNHLVAAVREELEQMVGVTQAPSFQQIIRWDRAIPQYNVGHLARLERIDRRLADVPGLSLAGNAYRGVGMNDCIRNAVQLAERLTSH
ncbi:MAG: protoporphyrinogen oxidase [Myxococcaceae bacterium]